MKLLALPGFARVFIFEQSWINLDLVLCFRFNDMVVEEPLCMVLAEGRANDS